LSKKRKHPGKPETNKNKFFQWLKKRKIKKRGKGAASELKYIQKSWFADNRNGWLKLKKKLYFPDRYKSDISQQNNSKITDLLERWKISLKKNENIEPIVEEMEKFLNQQVKQYKRNIVWSYIKSFLIAASIALFLRAFVFEPFRIPSGSMIPTLQVGDHIYVNKFIYGLRIPFTDSPPRHFANWSLPARGDIIVFIEPLNNSEDWIKRVVGLPGDHIRFDYQKRQIYLKPGGKGDWINVKREKLKQECNYMDKNEKSGENWHPGRPCDIYTETLGEHKYQIIYEQQPRYNPHLLREKWIVSKDCVFVMGDNRDNSEDSRFLSLDGEAAPCIPLNNIKGRAEFIWYSPGPKGQRWERIFNRIK
jgi:signal peptidase I